ncbi:MAG: phenylpyruvate tautomerase MIF-related protein [Cyanobacteria bacterium P01_H01_bin.35]
MPCIKVLTSAPKPDKETIDVFLKKISATLAKHTDRPEALVMTAVNFDFSMSFAGSTEQPVCFIEVRSISRLEQQRLIAMCQDFCQEVNEHLGVSKDHIYLTFQDFTDGMWGWNGAVTGTLTLPG